ncbi:hypothetical protein ACJ41O_012008 [Fusarium nematophilum]
MVLWSPLEILSAPPSSTSRLEDDAFIALKVGRRHIPESRRVAYHGGIYPAFGGSDRKNPARLVSSAVVDWMLLRSFMKECKRNHFACLPTMGLPSFEGLCFIDCRAKELQPAVLGEEYVALSYHFNEQAKPLGNRGVWSLNTSEAPLVVQDAMRVVVEMGHRYLWVERYCFNRDYGISQSHLQQVNQIYQNAAFVIVAAAGTNPSFGLPGVSTRAREPHPHATVDGRLLVSAIEPSIPSPKVTGVPQPREKPFSTRLLVFGSHQVSFHCLQGDQSEIFTSPVSWPINKSGDSHKLICAMWAYIERFSTQSSTYNSDALDALKATMNAVNRQVYDLCKPRPFPENAIVQSVSQVFGFGLAWTASGKTSDPQKRTSFPSWSLTSCDATIKFPRRWDVSRSHAETWSNPELDVSIEDLEGLPVPVSEYLEKGNTSKPTGYLHVGGWSLRDSLTFDMALGEAHLNIGDNKYSLTGDIYFDLPHVGKNQEILKVLCEKDNSKKRWEALIVWISASDSPFLVILAKVEDPTHPNHEVFERVGCVPSLRADKIPRVQRRHAASRARETPSSQPLMRWAADAIKEDDLSKASERERVSWRKVKEAEELEAAWQEALKGGCDPSEEAEWKRNERFDRLGLNFRRMARMTVPSGDGDNTNEEADNSPVTSGSATGSKEKASQEVNLDATTAELDDGTDEADKDSSVSMEVDSLSDEDSDSSETGDYFIDSIMEDAQWKQYFRRLPIVRCKLVIR